MLKLGTTGRAGAWQGALRRDGKIVATCPHIHRNRNSGWDTPAALCAEAMVNAVRNPDAAARMEAGMRRAAEQARRLGARVTDEERVAALHATLDAVRAAGAATEQVLGADGQPIMRYLGLGHEPREMFPAVDAP